MDLDIPLKRFAEYLTDAAALDKEHPHLHQQTWLSENFSFDNTAAHYAPKHQPWPSRVKVSPASGPYTSWWQRLARN